MLAFSSMKSSALVGIVFVGLRKASGLSVPCMAIDEISHVSSCVHIAAPYRGTIVALDHGMDAFFPTMGTQTLFNILHSMMTFRANY
jgi:hypothetical protein